MYSTKIQFAGAVDMTGKPLSRTTLGDPYVKGKREKNARFNGKQLGVKQCPKPAGLGTGTILPKALFRSYEYKSDPFKPAVPYSKTQPMENRKLGFGSHDAHKTDEFTNVIRTETYRYQLKQEFKHINKVNKNLLAGEEQKGDAEKVEDDDAPTLYEILHSKEADLFGSDRRRALRQKKRNTGHFQLSSMDVGVKCGDNKIIAANKSTHGAKNVTSQFFDTTHLCVGQM
jgi:hypothetical protein